MPMRSKKATPFAEIKTWWTRRAKKLARSMETHVWWKSSDTMGPWAIGLVVCLVAAVVIMTARAEITNATPERPQPVAQMARATQPQIPASSTRTARAETTSTSRAEAAPTSEVKEEEPARESTLATITGCLERKGESFRLEDTVGKDAPRSRSWKSGFIRKGSTSVGVVDSANKLNLTNHIGERVSLTGMLTDRELKASSVRRVAESCD
jgi:hypothetical protein